MPAFGVPAPWGCSNSHSQLTHLHDTGAGQRWALAPQEQLPFCPALHVTSTFPFPTPNKFFLELPAKENRAKQGKQIKQRKHTDILETPAMPSIC